MFEGIFLKNCCTSAQCIFVIAKDYAYILKKCQHKFKVEAVRVEVIAGVLPHARPVLCVTDDCRWHVAGSLHGPVSNNVRWRLLWWVMEKPDYFIFVSAFFSKPFVL